MAVAAGDRAQLAARGALSAPAQGTTRDARGARWGVWLLLAWLAWPALVAALNAWLSPGTACLDADCPATTAPWWRAALWLALALLPGTLVTARWRRARRSALARSAVLLLVVLASGACMRAARAAQPVAPASVPAPVGAAVATVEPFAAEIARFEAADRASPPTPGGIVLVGSSSFRLWPDLAGDFPGAPVVNRGFGGSTLPDVLRYAPRIVLPHRPRLVLVYAGDNDIASGRTPAQVLADYQAFVALVRGALPAARIAFVSVKPSPSRWALVDRQREANALVRTWIARDSMQAYVDVFSPMLGADGRPRPELFVADSLHMTRAGYAVWRRELAALVR